MVKRNDARSWVVFLILLTLFLATLGLRAAGQVSDTVSNLVCAALILTEIGVGALGAVRRRRQDLAGGTSDAELHGMRSDA